MRTMVVLWLLFATGAQACPGLEPRAEMNWTMDGPGGIYGYQRHVFDFGAGVTWAENTFLFGPVEIPLSDPFMLAGTSILILPGLALASRIRWNRAFARASGSPGVG